MWSFWLHERLRAEFNWYDMLKKSYVFPVLKRNTKKLDEHKNEWWFSSMYLSPVFESNPIRWRNFRLNFSWLLAKYLTADCFRYFWQIALETFVTGMGRRCLLNSQVRCGRMGIGNNMFSLKVIYTAFALNCKPSNIKLEVTQLRPVLYEKYRLRCQPQIEEY